MSSVRLIDGELTIQQRANKKRAELARRLAGEQIVQRLDALGVAHDQLSETERKQLISLSLAWHQQRYPGLAMSDISLQLATMSDVERWLTAEFRTEVASQPVVALFDLRRSPFYRLRLNGWGELGPIVAALNGLRVFDADTGQTASIEIDDDSAEVNFEIDPTLWRLGWPPNDDD